jgi:hypothetical protein
MKMDINQGSVLDFEHLFLTIDLVYAWEFFTIQGPWKLLLVSKSLKEIMHLKS